MKTKITTIIGLVALGMIGFTNINATAATFGMNALATVESEENLSVEAWMLDTDLWVENSGCKAEKAEKAEKIEIEKAIEVEAWMTEEEFFKAAESYTAASSAKEIEKYADKQITALKHEKENK